MKQGQDGIKAIWLPSHLTQAQAARHLDITRSAVGARVNSGTFPSSILAGTLMIPSVAILEQSDPVDPMAYAFTPDQVINMAEEAVQQLSEDPDRPMFSARQILGVYLGLSRLPYPPPAK